MKKTVLSILKIANVFLLLLYWLWPDVRGGLCYPHNDLINNILTTGLLILITSLIITIILLMDKKQKIYKNNLIYTILIIIYITPYILLGVSYYIKDYDGKHYKPEPCTKWNFPNKDK